MFLALTVLGCGILIPTTLVSSNPDWSSGASFFTRTTPTYMFGTAFWAYVVVAYVFDIIIMFFLWLNYRVILKLRRDYFDSKDYQRSLHSRTLLMTDIPTQLRSDEGIVKLAEAVKATRDTPRAAIARNVKDLPDMIEDHEEAVKELEQVLAKYFKRPDKLPAARPLCKAAKNDTGYAKGQKVDAIEYLTARIKTLESQIKEVRMTVDKRNALPYGFATYENIPDAHSVAFVARKGGPEGTVISMAPKPNDLIWKNLTMTKKERSWQNFINNLWVVALTIAWIAPNVLIAVFLSNLNHLGALWPAFETSLKAHPTPWSIAQGVLAPAITTLFYYFLPAIFRRLVTKAGDRTKTARERHVMHKLFSFFVFNNLIVFSLFSAAFGFVTAVTNAVNGGEAGWDAIVQGKLVAKIVQTMYTITPYWCSWLLQRNLGAAIDLGQLARLTWGSFSRRFLSPTPRQLIELTAPQPFEYAAYYNYFLFYTAVALVFGVLQPFTLAITALYFWMDSFSKKYMILYIFITKYESGGMFWRTLFNRILICALLSNVVTGFLVSTQGTWYMLAALAPLPFLLAGFKWYCWKTFDAPIHFYTQGKQVGDEETQVGESKRRKGDRVGTRFGHPALFKPLITPMVAAKSQHLLKQVYSGRMSLDETGRQAGYSDVYMDNMDSGLPGKTAGGAAPFEIVAEHEMDFEHWKNKPEFSHEAGGDGELYGRAADMVRPGTPSSMMTGPTRTGTFDSTYSNDRSRSQSRHARGTSRDSDATRVADAGTDYPQGYHRTPTTDTFSRPGSSRQESREGLVHNAARMAASPPPQLPTPNAPTPGGYGPVRYETPGGTPAEDQSLSYDYFRRGRQ